MSASLLFRPGVVHPSGLLRPSAIDDDEDEDLDDDDLDEDEDDEDDDEEDDEEEDYHFDDDDPPYRGEPEYED